MIWVLQESEVKRLGRLQKECLQYRPEMSIDIADYNGLDPSGRLRKAAAEQQRRLAGARNTTPVRFTLPRLLTNVQKWISPPIPFTNSDTI